MAESASIWGEIDRSESYLVCCMFEEAASLASSVLRHLCGNNSIEAIDDSQLNDMLESAGMVLVQSLKEVGRNLEILKELKLLFGSVTAIPIQVFLTGVCFQMSEGPFGVRGYLEEFLSKWRYVDKWYYVLEIAEANLFYGKGCKGQFVLGVDKYLEVVEVYAITLLGTVMSDMDLAISWVEKAALPEEKRQELLRRLHSTYSSKVSSSSQAFVSPLLADDTETRSACLKELSKYEGSSKALEAQCPSNGRNYVKQAILKLSGQNFPCIWWFRTFTLKFGHYRMVISNGKILLGCLMLLIYYFMRRKQATLKGILTKQALSMKKALIDLWQLAFSYQVNPLAAVQTLPSAMRGSQ